MKILQINSYEMKFLMFLNEFMLVVNKYEAKGRFKQLHRVDGAGT